MWFMSDNVPNKQYNSFPLHKKYTAISKCVSHKRRFKHTKEHTQNEDRTTLGNKLMVKKIIIFITDIPCKEYTVYTEI